jgi:hypothetical protein
MHLATEQPTSRGIRAAYWVCALITIGFFFVPAFVIRPFHYQSPRALSVAMSLKQIAPFWTLITGTLALLLAWSLWSSTRRWRKVILGASLLLVIASAAMARMNYFEWMFHPVKQYGFTAAGQTKLDNGEMVLALAFNGDARAYPIREMAYHHILNDVVGGVPVEVTY